MSHNDPAEGLQFRSYKQGEGSEQARPLKADDTTTRPPTTPIPPTVSTQAKLAKPFDVRGVFARIRARVRGWLS